MNNNSVLTKPTNKDLAKAKSINEEINMDKKQTTHEKAQGIRDNFVIGMRVWARVFAGAITLIVMYLLYRAMI